MSKSRDERSGQWAEMKANGLYLTLFVPVFVAVTVVLAAVLPYLILGITPGTVLTGRRIILFGAYVVLCVTVGAVIAAELWLRAVRGFVTQEQAARILGSPRWDRMGRWLIRRHLPDR